MIELLIGIYFEEQIYDSIQNHYCDKILVSLINIFDNKLIKSRYLM
jgi:hypothetical protein